MKNINPLFKQTLTLLSLVCGLTVFGAPIIVVNNASTLVDALQANQGEEVIIHFDPSLQDATIELQQSMVVGQKVTIEGQTLNVTIKYTPDDPSEALFKARTGEVSVLELRNITFQASQGSLIDFGNSGNQCKVLIEDCVFRENTLQTGGLISFGATGADMSDGLEIRNTLFENNTSQSSLISFNTWVAPLVIDNCYFLSNEGELSGAVYIEEANPFSITKTTFEKNKSAGNGGAIYIKGGSRTNKIEHCTFTGNEAVNGGAIAAATSVTCDLKHLTIFKNIASGQGGGIYNNGGTPSLQFSIVAGNQDGTGVNDVFDEGNGSEISLGNNLVSSDLDIPNPTDVVETDLFSYAFDYGNHGGFGKTFMPQSGADKIIDRVDVSSLDPPIESTATDQNNNLRVMNTKMDIGAVEYLASALISLELQGQTIFCTGGGSSVSLKWSTNRILQATNVFTVFLGNTQIGTHNGTDPTGYQSFAIPSSLAGGTYQVRVRASNPNITNSTIATIIIKPSPTVSVPANLETSCFGGTMDITATVTGGLSPYAYSWDIDGNIVGTAVTVTGALATVEGAELTVTDANNCLVYHSFTIAQPAVLTLANSVGAETCVGVNDGKITLTATGGTSPYAYILTTQAGVQDSNTFGVFPDLSAGTYVPNLVDAKGCTLLEAQQQGGNLRVKKAQAEIVVNAGVQESADWQLANATVCVSGDNLTLTDYLTGSVSTGVFSGNGVVSNEFRPIVAGVGSHVVKYTTTQCGVEVSKTITVEETVTPTITLTGETAICSSNTTENVNLAVSGIGGSPQYSWKVGGTEKVNNTETTQSILSLVTASMSTKEQHTIQVELTHQDPCVAGTVTTTLLSNELVVSTYPTVVILNTNPSPVVPEVSAGKEIVLSPFELISYDAFYDFELTLGTDPTPATGQWTVEGTKIRYKADLYDLTTDTNPVTLTENKCGGSPTTQILKIKPTNTAPTVTDAVIDGIKGRLLTIDLANYTTDAENNTVNDSVRIESQPTSGATATINTVTNQVLVDYSTQALFLGLDTLSVRVCDVEYCEVMDVLVNVKGDFYVNSKEKTVTQGGVVSIELPEITNATDYYVEVEGPFYSKAKAVIDKANRRIKVDWGEDPEFVGQDTVRYRICKSATHCNSGEYRINIEGLEPTADLGVEVYNALSPNDDGKNDFFEYHFILPDGEHTALPARLTVFNRWGDLVYENEAYNYNADNRFVGDGLLDGTYYYTIELKFKGVEEIFRGFLVLRK